MECLYQWGDLSDIPSQWPKGPLYRMGQSTKSVVLLYWLWRTFVHIQSTADVHTVQDFACFVVPWYHWNYIYGCSLLILPISSRWPQLAGSFNLAWDKRSRYAPALFDLFVPPFGSDRIYLTHCGLVAPYGDTIWVNIGSGYGGTIPLPEPMLTYH